MGMLTGLQRVVRQVLVLQGAESCLTRLRGEALHFYDAPGTGPGAPVVLVHGLAGSAQSFSRVLLLLRRRFRRVLALDFPGNGFSPLPARGPLRLEEHVRLLEAFCRDIVREPAFVVGNSLGGALAVHLAKEAPAQVKALALIAPAGARLTEERLTELLACFDVRNAAQARALTRRLFHRTPLPALLLASDMQKLYTAPSVRSICAEARELSALEPAWLSALNVPVLLLWGQSERLLPSESLEYFRTHLPPRAEVELVEGFGHVPQVEHPRAVVRRLERFADHWSI